MALVTGGTRGAGRGIAVELGAAGATVYVTGRTTRNHRSEYDRPETIEKTAELVTKAGGTGIPCTMIWLAIRKFRAGMGNLFQADNWLKNIILLTLMDRNLIVCNNLSTSVVLL